MMNKKNIILLLMLIIISLTIAQNEQQSYLNDDGTINFEKIDDIVSAINANKLSVKELLAANPPDDKLEVIFKGVSYGKQSEIIKEKFRIGELKINDEVSFKAKDSLIKTSKISNFDLSKYKDFDGKIIINQGGSISVIPKGAVDVDVGGESIHVDIDSELKIESYREGEIIVVGTRTIIYNGVKVKGTEYKVFIDSKDHSIEADYIQFKINEINVNVDNLRIEVTKEARYNRINILGGNNINLDNGEMSILYENNKIREQKLFGMPIKDLVVYDSQNNDYFYIDKTQTKLGEVKMTDFLSGGKATDVEEVDVEDDKRVIIRKKEVILSDGTKVTALEYQMWTSHTDRLVERLTEKLDLLKQVVDDDLSEKKISSQEAILLKGEIGRIKTWYENNEKYQINGRKFSIGLSNLIIREDGEVFMVPRPDSKAGIVSNNLGSPNPTLKGPSLKISKYITRHIFDSFQNLKKTKEM